MKRTHRTSRGLVIGEVLVAAAMGGTLLAAAAVALMPGGAQPTQQPAPDQPAADPPAGDAAANSARDVARRLKDQSHVRGIAQSLVLFSHNTDTGRFPRPSEIDRQNTTVPQTGRAKDTSSNLYSLLVFNGFVSTEFLISPSETNASIRTHEAYEYSTPQAAVKPSHALWDPGFSADFTDGRIGNVSYAHQTMTAARDVLWTFDAGAVPLVSNRGPRVSAVLDDAEGGPVGNPITDPKASNTFRFFSEQSSWRGHVGLTDGSVALMTSMLAPGISYSDAQGVKRADILFFDEPDDTSRTNHYLTITTHAGERDSNFRAIWD